MNYFRHLHSVFSIGLPLVPLSATSRLATKSVSCSNTPTARSTPRFVGFQNRTAGNGTCRPKTNPGNGRTSRTFPLSAQSKRNPLPKSHGK